MRPCTDFNTKIFILWRQIWWQGAHFKNEQSVNQIGRLEIPLSGYLYHAITHPIYLNRDAYVCNCTPSEPRLGCLELSMHLLCHLCYTLQERECNLTFISLVLENKLTLNLKDKWHCQYRLKRFFIYVNLLNIICA